MAAIHREGSDVFVDVDFFDADEVPVVPLTAQYRVVDGGGTEIVAWTNIPGSLAVTMTIRVTAAQNAVSSGTGVRFVAVKFTYGAGPYTGTDEHEYQLVNLHAVP